MRLRVLEGTYAFCRLDAEEPLPAWFALTAPLAAAVRRGDELSLVAPDEDVPPALAAERGFRALEVEGPLDLALTGVMAELSGALAAADVPIMPLATHDTDLILLRDERMAEAVAALRAAGHTVEP